MACQVTRSFANRACLDAGKATAAVPRYRRINCADAKTMAGTSTGEAGQSITETATCLNISRQTVSKLWKQFQNDGTVVRRPGQGRKRMTTASEDRYLALTARRNRKATARQLSSELAAAIGAVASRQTIYRRLNEKAFMPESQGYVFYCLHRKEGSL
ncbi:transposable element Tc1 transposase [Trichonephila clavipes]|nr:transposable element Tc1 transposase [Trichonephila clavipes]